MATIYDIAQATGLSTSTVSRALQGSRLVGPEVRARVAAAAEQLGYRTRVVRRSPGRAILSVRLVLPQPRNPARGLFYDVTELLAGLREGFAGGTLNLMCDLATPEYVPFPHKKGGDTDAFVFAFHTPAAETIAEIQQNRIPFVVLNRSLPDVPSIGTDNLAGMRALLAHVLAQPRPVRPMFVGLDRLGTVLDERQDAFLQAAGEAGLAVGAENCHIFPSLDAVRADAVAALADHANVLLAVNDIVGVLLLEELRGLGFEVPKQVAVTGFDDSPLRRLSRPLLTSFSLPVHALGVRAGNRLMEEILEKRISTHSELLVGKLLPGASTHPV